MTKTKHDEIVEQLDQLYAQAKRQILQNQSAITGLFPANSAEKSSASIKTSLWAASSIFALYLAYSKRVDNDQGKAHDLGQSVVKCMRGILFAWMRQSEKVEAFKANQSPKHALHLKFDLHSGLANDFEYPHLQIDVVSLYLIFLANFIASGLDIIYCMDEVTFIQNLVYYVERAYRTPDYGNWEPTSSPPPPPASQSNPMSASEHHRAGGIGQHFVPTPSSSSSSSVPLQSAAAVAPNLAHHNLQQQQQQHLKQTHFGPSVDQQPINYHQAASASIPMNHHQPHLASVPNHHHSEGQSQLEIHATSIGMAKSALEAINGCNLFGGKGANWSIIYSDIDAHSRNRSIFETLLPRESRSKNTDSYLLATISWPCFATNDPYLYNSTKSKILRKLKGKYGLKRFLRDPYGTVLGVNSGGENDPIKFSAAQQQQQQQQLDTSAEARVVRETSIGSTTSDCSSNFGGGGGEPKMKQRKSSYYQRKNFIHGRGHAQQNYQSPDILTAASSSANNSSATSAGATATLPPQAAATFLPQSGPSLSSSGSQSKLQRTDSSLMSVKRFENIESEWPLFVCFLIIEGIFKQDLEQIYENEKLLYERLLRIDPKHGDYLMPKYYYVPPELISNEKCLPDSVERLPSYEGSTSEQLYLTGQSILLITRLLLAGLIHPNELDPLRRHMSSHDRPKRIGRYSSFQATSSDLVVQTVLIAESIRLQAMMANYGIQTQTPLEVEPVQIWSSAQLIKVYEYLGVNEKLGLKGRPSRPIGALGTSKLYRLCGQTILCYPLIFEVSDFYLAQDMLLLIDDIQNELNFIGRYWRMSGRPTVCILIREEHLRDVHFRDLLDLLVQFKNGQLKKSGLRIKTGRLQNLISSSCIEHLDFLHLLPHEHLPQFKSFQQLVEQNLSPISKSKSSSAFLDSRSRTSSVSSSSHHHQQQQPQPGQTGGDQQLQLQQTGNHPPAKARRLLCSASAHNLQSIKEQQQNQQQQQQQQDGYYYSSALDDEEEDDQQADYHEARRAARTNSMEQLDFNMSDASMYRFYDSLENDIGAGCDEDHDQQQGAPNSGGGGGYSTELCQSIDYYECYKEAPTWPTLIELLRSCSELSGQSQLLAILWEREGAKYCVDEKSVEDRLERVSQLACQHRNWSVVRYCSAVLKRSVESLSPWLTSILVNGKQISLGRGPNEKIINNPLTPTEIHTLIYSTVNSKNPCDAVLQQEIALYIGRLISTKPEYFEGILTIRVANFMSAMRSYLNVKTAERRARMERLRLKQQQQRLQQQDTNGDPPSELLNEQQLLDLRLVKPEEHLRQHVAPNDMSADEEVISFEARKSSTGAASTSSNLSHHHANQFDHLSSSFARHQQIKLEPSTSTGSKSMHNLDVERQSQPAAHHSSSYETMSSNSLPRCGGTSTGTTATCRRPLAGSQYNPMQQQQQPTLNQAGRQQHAANKQIVARPLESLSPSDVRRLLVKVLTDDETLPISDQRQITGELCRVPKDFYDKVWSLLGCTNVGIVIGGKMLRSSAILTKMTQDDLNFALKVETLLSSIEDPKLRKVNVELLTALHVIFQRNPEIRFESEPIDLERIIKLSLDKFRADQQRLEFGLKEFYCNSIQTVQLYATRTVFDCLLPIKHKQQQQQQQQQ